MPAERIASLRTTTGEVYAVAQERTPARSFGARFMVLFDGQLEKLTEGITNGATLRVLLRLPKHLDFEAWKKLDQVKLAKELKMAQSSVSSALKELLERELVERRGSGAHLEWRLSMEWGWRGTVDQFHAARGRRGKPAPAANEGESIAAEGILWKFPCHAVVCGSTAPPDARSR